MLIVSIILLSVSLSVDALFVGFTYGLDGTRIPFGSKLLICAFSVIYAAAAIALGSTVAGLLPSLAGKIIGALILAGLGVFMIIKSKSRKKAGGAKRRKDDGAGPRTLCRIIIKSLGITIEILKDNPAAGDMDSSGVIDRKEALLLGFALSVDSLGAGIGSALSGLGGWYIPPAVGLCQLGFLSAGLICGEKLSARRERFSKCGVAAEVLPGFLLIALSVLRLF